MGLCAGSRQRAGDGSCWRYGRNIQKPGLANLTRPRNSPQIWLIHAKFTGLVYVEFNLPDQRIHIFELLFRSEITDKTHFEVFAIDISIKVEQMNFEHALGFTSAHSWAVAKIYHAGIDASFQCGLREINPIWRKLLAVSGQIRRREPDLFPEVITPHNRPQDR